LDRDVTWLVVHGAVIGRFEERVKKAAKAGPEDHVGRDLRP